jgi:hypothetical protein
VTADQFDTAARAIQPFGQQSYQRFIGSSVNRRGGNPDSQFVAAAAMRDNFISRRTRLEFHGKERTIRLGTKEIGNRCARHF